MISKDFSLHPCGRMGGEESVLERSMRIAPYGATWEEGYLGAMADVLSYGHLRNVRNGVTKSLFVTHLEFDLREGLVPLITTKYVPFDLVLAELLWFIEGGLNPNRERGEIYGRMSTKRLSEIAGKSVKIWDGDAANFAGLGKAKFEGDCGRIYGAQWRDYRNFHFERTDRAGYELYVKGQPTDQIRNLIQGLKKDPFSRYHRVTAWNPAELHDMALPACHCSFQCHVSSDKQGYLYLDLHLEIRSSDLFLGLPFNIASYALLTHMLAQVCGYKLGKLHITLLDYHIYVTPGASHENAVREQLTRRPYGMPRLNIDKSVKDINGFRMEHFSLAGYEHHPKLLAPLSTAVVKKV